LWSKHHGFGKTFRDVVSLLAFISRKLNHDEVLRKKASYAADHQDRIGATRRGKVLKARQIMTFGALIATGVVASSSGVQAQAGLIFGADGTAVSVTGPIFISQTQPVNVVGVVQQGPVNLTAIAQNGFYNRSVVVQFGTTNTATVTQDGTYNRSHVFQFGPTNAATVTQNGPFNASSITQALTGDPRIGLGVFVNNLLFAPETVAPQVELGQVATRTFNNTLFSRLDANRFECPTPTVNAAFAADLPRRRAAPVPVPVFVCPQFSVFVTGTYGHGDRDDRVGIIGYDYDLAAVTAGVEYRVNPNLLLGGAFNYTRTEADLNFGFGNIDLDSYQVGLFASLSYPNWFLDGAVTYGWHEYGIERTGFIAPVTAAPDGNSFSAAVKTGYLFDAWGLRLGPIAGLAYVKSWVDGYTESGDPLLTQSVREQELDALTGSAGVQVRWPFLLGAMRLEPYINLTVEHEFLDNSRVIATTFTLLPTTPILTPVLEDEQTYGKIAGGVRFEVTSAVSMMLSAESTFAREEGNDFALNAGVKVRF
jgi:outer membrane autotransporter protein